MPEGTDLPSVSIILAVLNEAEFIDAVVTDLLGQDYAGPLEVVVADGGSDDGTREKLDVWSRRAETLTVVSNPQRRQAFGLNLAAREASGEVLIRADGHTRYAPDYVSASVEALQELGGAVGGRMNPVGENGFEEAVAGAMNNPLTMGPARFHHAEGREEVDTVYLGAFAKSEFDDVGGFRAFPSGSSEDADFYYRWRDSGRKVFVVPAINTTYKPRGDAGSLWRQYWRYGLGKAEMRWVNGRFPSYRPLAPAGLILGFIGLMVVGILASWLPLLLLFVAWLAVLAWVGIASPRPAPSVMSAAGIMHLAYGLGVWWGLLRGPASVETAAGVTDGLAPR